MSDYEEMARKSDKDLINIITVSPNSAYATIAREILEYRKYLTARNQNAVIVALTVVIAIASAIDGTLRIIEWICPR